MADRTDGGSNDTTTDIIRTERWDAILDPIRYNSTNLGTNSTITGIKSNYMKSIEIRLRESNGVASYKAYCSDCWQEVEMTTDPSTSDHECTGERDVTVLQLDILGYEDNITDQHPIDFLEAKGLEVVAYTGDQADYCAYIAVKGDVSGLPDWFRTSGYRHEGKELI